MTLLQTLVGASFVAFGLIGWWLFLHHYLPLAVVDIVPVLVGGGLTVLGGAVAGRVVSCGDVTIDNFPPGVDKRILSVGDNAGAILGLLERVFFFSTIWISQPAGIAVWFGLKVAAKWNAWSHIAKVPENQRTYQAIQAQTYRFAVAGPPRSLTDS